MRIKTKTFFLFSIILLIQLALSVVIVQKALFLGNRLLLIEALDNNLVVSGKVRNQIGRELLLSLLYTITGDKKYVVEFDRTGKAVHRLLGEWQQDFSEKADFLEIESKYAAFHTKNRKLFRQLETGAVDQGYRFFNNEILGEFSKTEGKFLHRTLSKKIAEIDKAYDELLLAAGWFPFGVGTLKMQMQNAKKVHGYFLKLNETVSYINRYLTNSALLFLSSSDARQVKEGFLGHQFDFILHQWKEALEDSPDPGAFLSMEGKSFLDDVEGALLHIQKKMKIVKERVNEGKRQEGTRVFVKSIEAIVDFILYPTIDSALGEGDLLVFSLNSEIEKTVGFSRNVTIFLLILGNVFVFFTSLRFLRELNRSFEAIVDKIRSFSQKKGGSHFSGDDVREIESLCEEKEQEIARLVKRNRLFKIMIEGMKPAFFIVSREFQIEKVNKAFGEMLGYRRKEIEGVHLSSVFPKVAKREKGDLEDFFIKGGNNEAQGTLISKEGKKVRVLISASLVENQEHQGYGLFVAQKLEQESAPLQGIGGSERNSSHPKPEFSHLIIGGLVKEYNRPLKNILGYLRFTLENYKGKLPADIIENLEALSRESQAGVKLSETLLSFLKKERDDQKKYSVSTAIENAIERFLKNESVSRPIFHKNLDAVNPALFFEKGKLEFLFFSLIRLLSYSADSRGESPEIHINTILQDGYVKIVFSDSSNPFPDDFISLSGLLSMIRGYPLEFGALVVMVFSVVHDQGGKIRGQRKITTALDEEREKLSLRFIMELPVSPVVGKPKKVPLSTVPHTVAVSLKGRKVLVVDDEKTIRIWLNSLLVERGATPTLCSDGVEAIQEVEKNRFDFILSDVKMPELSGYELGEWLEKQSPDMLPRLILITGLRDKELDEFCLQKRCHSLTKPFTSDALLSLVSKILDQVTI